MAPPVRRGRRTVPARIVPGSQIVVVPIGSWEQHGSHLPHDTDSLIAESLVDAAIEGLDGDDFVVAPTIAISASDEHAGFPGLLSAGTDATAGMLVSIARSASAWARGTVLVSGHGGNSDALARARAVLHEENVPHSMWWPRTIPGHDGDLHAGWIETSVMLHIAPDLVDLARADAGASGDPAGLMARMRDRGVAAVSANGIIGDPRGATAVDGEAIHARWVEALVACLDEARRRWPLR
ncbi:MAG: mycofactocin biosynthesis peptidyl-dipeptidase MftE, partial [Actinomycetota bacterium]